MLALIWLEIVTKHYDELCHKISRSSLTLKTDSVDIIFQHRLRLGSSYFLNKKSVILIFYLDICTKFTVIYVYRPINWELQFIWQNANMLLCTYPLLTLVQNLRPIALMAIVLKHLDIL